MTVTCPYCLRPAKLVSGSVIYPNLQSTDIRALKFWQCAPCNAYVGTHKLSKDHNPLGILANKELREWKVKAHAAFDPLWKSGKMHRKEAYRHLQSLLGMDRQPHIGFMTIEECKRVVTALG